MKKAAGGFEFRRKSPDGAISELVETIWFARGTVPYASEAIAPTGSVVAIIILGDPIEQTMTGPRRQTVRSRRGLIVGPHDLPIVNRPLGETHAVGIVATPVGCEALFGFQPARLRGCIHELFDIWPEASALWDRVLQADGPWKKIGMVHDALSATANPNIPGLYRCRQAVHMMEADPSLPVKAVAQKLGISIGHLDREFSRIVGLSPRKLSGIVRVRALLRRLDVTADIDWVGLALEHGWYDQAHFIRAFKRYTGVTPTRYVAAQIAAFDRKEFAEAAGFVPEISRM